MLQIVKFRNTNHDILKIFLIKHPEGLKFNNQIFQSASEEFYFNNPFIFCMDDDGCVSMWALDVCRVDRSPYAYLTSYPKFKTRTLEYLKSEGLYVDY